MARSKTRRRPTAERAAGPSAWEYPRRRATSVQRPAWSKGLHGASTAAGRPGGRARWARWARGARGRAR
eukprot:scaffold82778_cov63-Phaeocystis_antarctica.AAC.2